MTDIQTIRRKLNLDAAKDYCAMARQSADEIEAIVQDDSLSENEKYQRVWNHIN